MHTIRQLGILEPGDVVADPDGGFAVVDRVTATEVCLAGDGDEPGQTLSEATTLQGWQLCTPWGFCTRLVRDRDALRHLVHADPVQALRLLLDELEARQTVDDLQRWMVGHHLVGRSRFERWWDASVSRLGRGSDLVWDGRHLAWRGLDPSVPGDPEAFLALGPSGRFRTWQTASPSGRQALLDVAVEEGHTHAILLGLRSLHSAPPAIAPRLRALALDGDPWLLGALLVRLDAESLDAAAELARNPVRRGMLDEAVATLHPNGRLESGVAVLSRLTRGEPDAKNDAAANHVVGLLPGGAAGALRAAKGRAGHPGRWPGARAWLEDAVRAEAASRAPLLRELRRLPVPRLFSVSLGLARALAERHARGEAGGVPDARILRGDAARLGPVDAQVDCRDDVRAAARVLVERAIGTLPDGDPVRAQDLILHLAQLVPDVPASWVAVMTRALSPEPGLRPTSGLDLWEQLAVAQALHSVRKQAPARTSSTLDVAFDTHIGAVKARTGQTNQDALFWQRDGPLALLVVADGISVSTAGSGDLAAALLVQTMAEAWDEHRASLQGADRDQAERFVVQALARANDRICERSLELAGGQLAQRIPMGTTVVVALVRGEQVLLASLGDSRAYLVGASGAALLTGDQNLRGEWLRGWQKGNQPTLINEGYALVGYCGHFDERARSAPVPPRCRHLRLLPGEVLLLCSDGLTDYAAGSPAEAAMLVEEAAQRGDLQEACRWLVARANDGGGGDNITVMLARHGA